jgi:hypothetical protein
MGSKASGKHYTSKGERRSSISTRSSDPAVHIINVQKAYWAGGNPWVVMDNPNKNETAKRKIRVRANELWGSPKEREKYRFIIAGS